MDEYVVSLRRIALMRDYDGKYINERYNGWIVIMQDWNDWERLGSEMGMKVMTDGNDE